MILSRHFFAIAGLCLVLYAPGISGPFLFDSYVAIAANPALDFDASVFDQWRLAALSSTSGPLGRPVSMLSFAANSAVGGVNAAGFKFTNVLLHLLIAYLVYRFLARLLQQAPALNLRSREAGWIAFAAAGLWLLHPLQVSTVLYSVQRMEQLSTLFVLLGLLAYLHYRCRWLTRAATAQELSNCALLLLLSGLLAVYSKEDGVLLPLLVLITELLLLRGHYAGRERPWLLRSCAILCLAPFALVLLLAVLEPGFLKTMYGWRPWSPAERLLTQGRVLWHYVGWFYLPDVGAMSLFHDDIEVSRGWMQPLSTLAAALAWLVVLIFCTLRWRKSPVPVFCAGFFLTSHLLESSLVPLDLAYEHRSYLGNMGLALLPVWLGWRLLPAPALRVAALLVLLVIGFALALRSYQWSDELRLAESQLRHHPESARASYYYANLQMRLADQQEDPALTREHVLASRRYFEYLLQLEPDSFPALASLVYIDSRWFPELDSAQWMQKMIDLAALKTLYPSDANALDLLTRCAIAAYCRIEQQDYVALFERLQQSNPGDASLLLQLARYHGLVLFDYPAAIAYTERALQLSPNELSSYFDLSGWYVRAGEPGQAMMSLQAVLIRDERSRELSRTRQALQ
ncbi:MAG: hypothetical protein ABJ308_07530 [Halieaceae bacterium]